MNTIILGISAFYHDSAAAIVRDGEIIAAAQEERFTRKKYDPRFPSNAIHYCLEEAFVNPKELAAVVFYDNPPLTFDRVIKNQLTVAPSGMKQWMRASRSILGIKILVKKHITDFLGTNVKVLFADHHMAHAASAFYPSPFSEAAILTADGVGEWATTTIGLGRDNNIRLLKEIRYPHSLGLLYSAMTYYCGFRVNSGEHKLMGLAPYGQPVYAEKIRQHLIDLKDDGSFQLNTDYFGFLNDDVMTNDAFHDLFEGEPRLPESEILQRHADLAASVQRITEEAVLKLALHAREITGCSNLVMAGGVALNCVANGKIVNERIFDNVWIQPAAGDAGGSLGAALLATHQYFNFPRQIHRRDSQKGGFLGPAYGSNEISAFLERKDYPHQKVTDAMQRAARIADALADGKIVGYMAGRMEFGPRSLGARSIFADPRPADMQSRINQKIKFRESFRPFAPAVLAENVSEYFELDVESPYMMLVAAVRNRGIPAVTHVDSSARVQTVNPDDKADLWQILTAFRERTGCAVLVNTSFNVRGEPIVCTPQDAYRCFMTTGIDLLVLEDCLLWKKEQPPYENHREQKKVHSYPDKEKEELVADFFKTTIIPLAKECRIKGKTFFPTGPDPGKSTYFISPERDSLKRQDFELEALDSNENFVRAITTLWINEGNSELARMEQSLLYLIRELSKEEQQQSEELPAFIYTMF